MQRELDDLEANALNFYKSGCRAGISAKNKFLVLAKTNGLYFLLMLLQNHRKADTVQ